MSDISQRIPTRYIAHRRQNSPFALAALLMVCLGLLYVIFAPKGSFVIQPTPVVVAE